MSPISFAMSYGLPRVCRDYVSVEPRALPHLLACTAWGICYKRQRRPEGRRIEFYRVGCGDRI